MKQTRSGLGKIRRLLDSGGNGSKVELAKGIAVTQTGSRDEKYDPIEINPAGEGKFQKNNPRPKTERILLYRRRREPSYTRPTERANAKGVMLD